MPDPNSVPLFRCKSCFALYQVVKTQAGPETVDPQIACRAIRKLHAGSAKGRSPPAKGNSSLNTFSCGKRAALMHGGHGKAFYGQNPLRGARRRRCQYEKARAVKPGQFVCGTRGRDPARHHPTPRLPFRAPSSLSFRLLSVLSQSADPHAAHCARCSQQCGHRSRS